METCHDVESFLQGHFPREDLSWPTCLNRFSFHCLISLCTFLSFLPHLVTYWFLELLNLFSPGVPWAQSTLSFLLISISLGLCSIPDMQETPFTIRRTSIHTTDSKSFPSKQVRKLRGCASCPWILKQETHHTFLIKNLDIPNFRIISP